MIVLHDKFKTVNRHEVTNQNIPNLFCYIYFANKILQNTWAALVVF